MDDSPTIFEAVEFREPALQPGERYSGPIETSLGEFEDEKEAIEVARTAWQGYLANPTKDVAWWMVRVPGEELARWIAESRSDIERVLDLTTKQLVAVRR